MRNVIPHVRTRLRDGQRPSERTTLNVSPKLSKFRAARSRQGYVHPQHCTEELAERLEPQCFWLAFSNAAFWIADASFWYFARHSSNGMP